jgi:hypothetical protein
MIMAKPEFEFFPVTEIPWTRCAGDADGLDERVLARNAEAGTATRILRFAPGTDTSPNGVQRHDFWEEVYILEGSLYDVTLQKTFTAGMFACRPPGMAHGPWTSADGCVTFEVRY